jgi:hypothetical protein
MHQSLGSIILNGLLWMVHDSPFPGGLSPLKEDLSGGRWSLSHTVKNASMDRMDAIEPVSPETGATF